MTPGELKELQRLYAKRGESWGCDAVWNAQLDRHVEDLLKLAAEAFKLRNKLKRQADARIK